MRIRDRVVLGFLFSAALLGTTACVALLKVDDIAGHLATKTWANEQTPTSEITTTERKFISRIVEMVDNTTFTVRSIAISAICLSVLIGAILWYSISRELRKARRAVEQLLYEQNSEISASLSSEEFKELIQSVRAVMPVRRKHQKTIELESKEKPAQSKPYLLPDIERQSNDSRESEKHEYRALLNCLYGIVKIVEEADIPLEHIFHQSVQYIRQAFPDPANTFVRITYDGLKYQTKEFTKSEQSLRSYIYLKGERHGHIEVFYKNDETNERKAFTQEQSELLEAAAMRLGNMTENRQAREKLELFRKLTDRSNDCIFVLETEWGRFLDVNDRACEVLGYTRHELLTTSLKNIDLNLIDDNAWKSLARELVTKGDMLLNDTFKRKDGSFLNVELSLRRVGREREEYIIVVARDISERKRAEQHQSRLLTELASANNELKDFAHIVSHDLKAPLRGIKMVSEMLSRDLENTLSAKDQEKLDMLNDQVDRMRKLIDGVLQYSRVGTVRERLTRVDLDELVSQIVDTLCPPDHIRIDVDNKLPIVVCEHTRILQVFQNLIGNAIKYNDKSEGRINVRCVEEGDFWHFEISDNGPGIEENDRERIFKIFQTLKPTSESDSTGVGLSIVKKVIELYGGKIWVESCVNEGTTFHFTLPKAGAQQNTNQTGEESEAVATTHETGEASL